MNIWCHLFFWIAPGSFAFNNVISSFTLWIVPASSFFLSFISNHLILTSNEVGTHLPLFFLQINSSRCDNFACIQKLINKVLCVIGQFYWISTTEYKQRCQDNYNQLTKFMRNNWKARILRSRGRRNISRKWL